MNEAYTKDSPKIRIINNKLIFNIFGNKTAWPTSDAMLELLDTEAFDDVSTIDEELLKVPEVLMKNLDKKCGLMN